MKSKQYVKPMTEIVWLQEPTQLMAGSGESATATISDFEEDEWDIDPLSRTTDLPETPDSFSD